MIFNSLTYIIFLAFVVPIYWALPFMGRMLLIFSSSLAFYGFWRVEFIPLLIFSASVDWWISNKMEFATHKFRKNLLILSLLINISLLILFKYLLFFFDSLFSTAKFFGYDGDGVFFKIALPLGISFYTFQTISYTVDVYRQKITPEKNYLVYISYVTFFPQLVAGPILRAGEVIKQFKSKNIFCISNISEGIRRIIYGLFLKVVLADNIAPFVDAGYGLPVGSLSAFDVWTLSFLFGFQIYFDFSAYSHIAIGSARLIGIRFPENFNFPYLSASPKEFWKRWHISLSSWIRDYLYLPLCGSKGLSSSQGGLAAQISNGKNTGPLFLTWTIMGLWHGANWTFVVWGLYHAMIIFFYRILTSDAITARVRVPRFVGIAITFSIMMLGWVPFRAGSVEISLTMWGKLFDPMAYTWLGMRENAYLVAFIVCVSFLGWAFVRELRMPQFKGALRAGSMVEILGLVVITLATLIFLQSGTQFIYFQF